MDMIIFTAATVIVLTFAIIFISGFAKKAALKAGFRRPDEEEARLLAAPENETVLGVSGNINGVGFRKNLAAIMCADGILLRAPKVFFGGGVIWIANGDCRIEVSEKSLLTGFAVNVLTPHGVLSFSAEEGKKIQQRFTTNTTDANEAPATEDPTS